MFAASQVLNDILLPRVTRRKLSTSERKFCVKEERENFRVTLLPC